MIPVTIAMRALSLFRKIPLWAFAIATLVVFAWLQTSRLETARKGWNLERDNHEVTRGSVRILATAVVMQNAAVDALKAEANSRAKTGRDALQTRAKGKVASLVKIERIVTPAPLSGRCVTPAIVLESGL